jgi:DNA-binding GntR family transcriptional regulator
VEVTNILSVQEVLTGLAARLAAENIEENGNAELVEEAYRRLARFRKADISEPFPEERRLFHDALIHASGNPELQRVMPRTHVHLLRMQFQPYLTETDRDRQFADYEAVATAVLAKEPRKAEQAMRRHLRHTRASWTKLPDEAFPAHDD